MPKALTAPVLTPQELAFIRLVTIEGLTIAKAAKHEEVGIHPVTGYKWWKRPEIQEAVDDILAETKRVNRMAARSRLEKAWETVDKAMKSPAITPTQLKAAAMVLMYANGSEGGNVDGAPTINVQLNTQLNTNVLAEQQARHSQPVPIVEGGYTLLSDGNDDEA